MDTYPDPLMKKIIIPVAFKDGKFQLLDGRNLPKIKEGAIGNLELSEYDVLDGELVCELRAESDVVMLAEGKKIYFAISPNMVPDNLKGKLIPPEKYKIFSNYKFVEVILNEPLRLHLRGSKIPQLLNCQCTIPCLKNLKADSMNYAYTLVSRHFEKKRKSHSGNVFQKGYCYKGNIWMTLDELRIQTQGK